MNNIYIAHSQINFDPELDVHKEDYTDIPSMTLPDEALSVNELFALASQGVLPDIVSHNGEIDEDMPDIKDLTDLDYVLPSVEDSLPNRLKSGKNEQAQKPLSESSEADVTNADLDPANVATSSADSERNLAE